MKSNLFSNPCLDHEYVGITRRKSDLFDYKNAFPTLQSFELEKFVTIWSTVGPPYRNLGTPYIF